MVAVVSGVVAMGRRLEERVVRLRVVLRVGLAAGQGGVLVGGRVGDRHVVRGDSEGGGRGRERLGAARGRVAHVGGGAAGDARGGVGAAAQDLGLDVLADTLEAAQGAWRERHIDNNHAGSWPRTV